MQNTQQGSDTVTSASPFANLLLSVDSYTLDTAAGKRRLRSIDPDGTLTYDEPKPPNQKRSETLARIWDEYPNGLLDLSEDALRTADPSTTYGPTGADAEKDKGKDKDGANAQAGEPAGRESGQLMTAEEMEALRTDVFMNLNEARNELWFILELAKTLAASSGLTSNPPPEPIPSAPGAKKGKAKGGPAGPGGLAGLAASLASPAASQGAAAGAEGEPPVLPAGTYTTTPSAAPVRPPANSAYTLELALADKHQALDDCGALIDAAVDELRLMASASERFCDDVRTLRDGAGSARGQWAVVPKPDFAARGGLAGSSAVEMAKDVVIPYALDEAPAAIRQRSLAAFDLDPRKMDGLSFGARSFLRLRILLREEEEGGRSTLSASAVYEAAKEDNADVVAVMQAAQLETVDEDMFNELRIEAARIDGAEVEPRKIAIKAGSAELTIEMYDTRETPTAADRSPLCDALLATARLGLMHAYQRRKQRLIDAQPASSTPSTSSPSILYPLIHTLMFRSVYRSVRGVLSSFRSALEAAGISSRLVERHAAAETPEAIVALLSASAKVDVLGVVFSLEIAGQPGVTVNLTAPNTVVVITPRASLTLRDVGGLPDVVATTVATQLSDLAYDSLRAVLPEDDSRIFFDELDSVVVVGGLGALSITFPSPFDTVHVALTEPDASVRSLAESILPYDSTGEQSLRDWLHELGRQIPSGDEYDERDGM